MLSLDFKMKVLPIVNKQIRESVITKTRDLQFYNFVSSEVIMSADELTPDHNLKLASLKIISDWHLARTLITSA